MVTTYFKPSIHGWPFKNEGFIYTFVTDPFNFDSGFCGGMCWTALSRFYQGSLIPRDTPKPSRGEDLYEELERIQENSLPLDIIWKIYRWQMSPDQSHVFRMHSLGERTQNAWPGVKDRLDSLKPVTLTLITSSSDYNPFHLGNNHRVVAYAYYERPLYDGEGAPGGADTAVIIYIYDPNYPNCDDVYLKFYLHGTSNKIKMTHSMNSEVHGFFLDDKNREFIFPDNPSVLINNCIQTGIPNRSTADYELKFSWKCKFIPYFCLQIDNGDWALNDHLKRSLVPTIVPSYSGALTSYFNNKQCPSRIGEMTLNIKVGRKINTVGIRLLDSNNFVNSLTVDATPAIECHPYVRSSPSPDSRVLTVMDATESDLFIKNQNPTEDQVQQLDTSPFRWIFMPSKTMDIRSTNDPLGRISIQSICSFRLGNLKVPVWGSIVERNLALPTIKSGSITTIRGFLIRSNPISSLGDSPIKIFNGFINPKDFDQNLIIKFQYQSKDRTNIIVNGEVEFYGQSIIYSENVVVSSTFDPSRIAQMEAAVEYLVELGLIDKVIELIDIQGPGLDPRNTGGPLPEPVDYSPFLERMHSSTPLMRTIKNKIKATWKNKAVWQELWQIIQRELYDSSNTTQNYLYQNSKPGEIIKSLKLIREINQQKYDAIITDTLSQKVIKELILNNNFVSSIQNLFHNH